MSAWIRCPNIDPSRWDRHDSLHSWWIALLAAPVASGKGLRSLIILVLWEIWPERNHRIYRHKEPSANRIVNCIKDQTAVWITVGAKHLQYFVYAT
uniref:Uncharacterized protein n=1 Tax=Setaria viridis TaxID=4556 RepID=A0A4U6VY88_SETVI|nr:hypothetical protein SEVIR_2G286550v2 [Setaria viridis]